ncbi:MAG: hypothetical protein EOO53_21095 [Gammaproteobacteria bacterium]|nr:MAG: hypothetical protein EOO53_21095 [Gammaproteobacteria bacterium]
MRKTFSILSLLIFSLSSCGQSGKEYHFQEIGLHIKVPNGYLIEDSFPKPSFLDENGKQITDPAKRKELEADLMKGLLVVSTSERKNTASFNLAMETPKTGSFEKYFIFSKDMQKFMSMAQMNTFDTLSSTMWVGNIAFRKFLTFSDKQKPSQYSEIYVAQVKNYFLIIKADYSDKKFGEDIEKAILTSKFD